MARKKLEKRKYLYIFHHLEKNGGSSFRKQFEKNISRDNLLKLDSYKPVFEDGNTKKAFFKVQSSKIARLSIKRKNKIWFIYGPFVAYGIHKHFDKEARYIMFVRNPQKRAMSWYNYLVGRYKRDVAKGIKRELYQKQLLVNGRVPTFKKWLSKKYAKKDTGIETMDQHLKRWGYLDGKDLNGIRKMLDKFFFIGITGELSSDLRYLSTQLGFNKFFIKRNVSKKLVTDVRDSKTRKILKQKNKVDELIFNEALKKRRGFIKKHKDYWKKVRIGKIKRALFLPITQVIFDFKGLLIQFSAFLRRKSSLYEKYFDTIRGYK